MPRIARITAPGFPHHIVQRGNNKEQIFFDNEDYRYYLKLIIKYSDRWTAPVLAYCLMKNHLHLLIKPLKQNSLYKMMQGISLCYTQYSNRKYSRTGRLWECRYYSSIIDTERYLWTVARYIEQNPCRTNYVNKPENYIYSSARYHIIGDKDFVIGEDIINESERKDYVKYISTNISDKEINILRRYTRSGKPLGRDSFISKIEAELQRDLRLRAIGRPWRKR